MPKFGDTSDITEEVFEQVVDSRSHPVAVIEYYDQRWRLFDDVTGFSVSKSGVNNDFNAFSLVPPSSSFNMSVFNARQKYSPGTGNQFDGVLVRNRKVRARLGYKISDRAGKNNLSGIAIPTTTGSLLYHVSELNGVLTSSIASAPAVPSVPGIPLTYYGVLYGSGTYSPSAVWVSELVDFGNVPITGSVLFKVTADTALIDVYARTSFLEDDLATEDFEKIGETVNGLQTITTELSGRYFQVAFVWKTSNWGVGQITGTPVIFASSSAYFDQGVYLLDDPSFSASYGSYSASSSGRDYFKKAIETKISTPKYTSADVSQIIRDVCDRAAIPCTSLTVPDTGVLVTLSEDDTFKNVTAKDAFNECLEYLNGVDDNWRIRMNDDGFLELFVKAESSINADFNYTYQEALFSFQKTLSSNNFLQVATVGNKAPDVSSEYKLRTLNITPSPFLSVSWARTKKTIQAGGGGEHNLIVGDYVMVSLSSDETAVPIGIYLVTFVAAGNVFSFEGFDAGASVGTLSFSKVVSYNLEWDEQVDKPWTRVTNQCTVTNNNHQLEVGDVVSVSASSLLSAIPIGTYVVTFATTNTFTFTCINEGLFFAGILSYSKAPVDHNPEAVYKRIEIIENSTGASVIVDNTSLTDVDLTVSGTGFDIDVTIYGCYLKADGVPIIGEAVNSSNWQGREGITKRFINRLIQTSADAQAISEKLIDIYGNQNFKASLNIPFDPLREIDDKITIWEKFTNTARIFAIESISHNFSASGATARTSLGLVDLGVDFAGFNWDRHNVINGGMRPGLDDILYDSGRLWDEGFGVNVTEDGETQVDDYRNIG